MALVLADRVKETSGTTGTGDLSLAGATTGFQRFADAIGDGNTTYYAVSLVAGGEFEIGLGTYLAATNSLRRDTILDSSNAGATVNFSTGTKDVFVVYPANRAVVVDGSTVDIPNSATVPLTGGGTGASSASSARSNLGLGSAAVEDDTRYAHRSNNLDDLDSASTSRTNLGLGDIATQDASSVDINGGTIDGVKIGETTTDSGKFTSVEASSGFTGDLDGNVTGQVSDISNHDTDDLSEGTSNLYYTDARVDGHLSGGTGVTYSSGSISIGQDVGTSAAVQFATVNTGQGANELYAMDQDVQTTDSVTFVDAEFTGTGAVELPEGTQAQRPGSPGAGMLRFNSDTALFEGYNGSAWSSVGGSEITNDTSTSTDVFPLFADATSGVATDVFTSDSNLLYQPNTGELKVKKPVAKNGIFANARTITEDTTIDSDENAMSTGPIDVASGVTVTVETGARWVVI